MVNKIKKIIIIEHDVILEGKIYSPYPTEIKGIVIGEIISKESVTIERFGEVRGNIKTESAVIRGSFTGNLIASGNVEVNATGRLIGNIITKSFDFIIEPGGVFEGRRFSVKNEEIFTINEGEDLCTLKIKVNEVV